MLRLILLPLLLVSCSQWELQSSHPNVIPNLTDDVTLRCFYNSHQNHRLTYDRLTRIRILKGYKEADYRTIAEITVPVLSNATLTKTNDDGVTASGYLGKATDSFLSVTWSLASEETVGTYRCEVDGFELSSREDVHANSRIINVTNVQPTTKELVDMMIGMKHHFRSVIEDNFLELRYWPTGNYTLLSPATGCPDTPYTKMVRGFAMMKTETITKPNHTLSSPTHLYHDVFERCDNHNTVHFRFCRNPIPDDQIIQWPKGSFCIHNYNWPTCPPGFTRSLIRVYVETLADIVKRKKAILNTVNFGKDVFNFTFCCRSDGDPNVPILLPNKRPFYLYRHKGKCQKVRGMDSSPEWLQIDSDDSKSDSYVNKNTALDSSLNDIRIEMCYYSRRRSL